MKFIHLHIIAAVAWYCIYTKMNLDAKLKYSKLINVLNSIFVYLDSVVPRNFRTRNTESNYHGGLGLVSKEAQLGSYWAIAAHIAQRNTKVRCKLIFIEEIVDRVFKMKSKLWKWLAPFGLLHNPP